MKTNMKTIALALMVAGTLASCQKDKKADLIKLKREQQELTDKIAALEKEINATEKGENKTEGTQVAVTPITTTRFEHAIEVQGSLDGEQNVKVFPKSQGIITEVYVQVGSAVKKGQAIARFDDAAFRKQLAQMVSQYNLAKELYDRQKRLWDQKIGSEVQYMQAKTQKESLENGVAALREQLEYMVVKSPITGNVEDLPIKIGQAASPQMPVATVINFSSLKVVANIAEAYNTSISGGDSVRIWFPDLKQEIRATVSTASKYINPVNRSFEIEVRIPNNIKNLKANMIAVVKVIDYKKENAIKVPVNLIQTDSKGDYVYVATNENNKQVARKKYVVQGKIYAGYAEITEGLSAGDRAITAGQLGLSEGASIQF